jgi:DedD protein
VLEQGDEESLTVEDVNRELTYFRTLGEGESSPEVDAPPPEPEARPATLEPGARKVPNLIEESTLGGGRDGFMIQVMATKDLSSAIAMRQRLTEHGYRVVISEGRGAVDAGLRKVRVGPYGTRAEAERVAKRLEAEEGVRTWIP